VKSIGIPGEVAGLENAFKRYGSGKVTWKSLVEPSVLLARNGIAVTEVVDGYLKVSSLHDGPHELD